MILRSQLRMNKNVVFPFISCIMIMFTLLVLIHKSADELNTTKKELNLCKQQHESLYTQLQSAIEYKARLEKSLENEKTDGKQQLEKMQNDIKEEKEDCKKEKEVADKHFEELRRQNIVLKEENQGMKESNEKFRKKIIDIEDEKTKLGEQLKATRSEKEQLSANKNKMIEDLQLKLKNAGNSEVPANKITPEVHIPPPVVEPEKIDAGPSFSKGSTTPVINPQAIGGHEESPKQVGPPPNGDQENINKEMLNSLNLRNVEGVKPDENVINAPQVKADEDKERDKIFNAVGPNYDKKGDSDLRVGNIEKNMPNMFLPIPLNLAAGHKPASSASNNAAEQGNRLEDQQDVLPPPVPNVLPNEKDNKIKDIQKQAKEYQAVEEYGKDVGEDDGGAEDDYVDKNEAHVPAAGLKAG